MGFRWSTYQPLIGQDCNEFYSKYAKENPEREGMAESFVVYFGLRFRRSRLTARQAADVTDIGPNRLRFFYQNLDATLSGPPMNRPVGLVSADPDVDDHTIVRLLPQSDSPPEFSPTNQQLEELAAEYLAEAEYLESIGVLNATISA